MGVVPSKNYLPCTAHFIMFVTAHCLSRKITFHFPPRNYIDTKKMTEKMLYKDRDLAVSFTGELSDGTYMLSFTGELSDGTYMYSGSYRQDV
jgi:hypothetical protein